MNYVGIEYLIDQWWWDLNENVLYYGDPDLRIFVPGTDYSDENYWDEEDTKPLRYDEDISINGHTPFGATKHPHEKAPMILEQYVFIILVLVIIVILIAVAISRKKKNK